MQTACSIIGVGGPSGSGKTTLSRALRARLGAGRCAVLEMDRYYHDLGHVAPAERGARDFDVPEALDVALLVDHLRRLGRGEAVRVPDYDFASHTRVPPGRMLRPPRLVVVEGIFCLAYEPLRRTLDWSVFVSTPDSVCLARRLDRDVNERGRTPEEVRIQYARFVRPAAERVVIPSARFAARIVSGVAPVDELCDEILAELENQVHAS